MQGTEHIQAKISKKERTCKCLSIFSTFSFTKKQNTQEIKCIVHGKYRRTTVIIVSVQKQVV